MRAVKLYSATFGSLFSCLVITACTTVTPSSPVYVTRPQTPLPITAKQQEECLVPELTEGQSKVEALLNANVAIENCEAKRRALTETIVQYNTRIKSAAEKAVTP